MEGDAEPDVGVGGAGVEIDGFLKAFDGDVGAAAERGREIEIADSLADVGLGGFGVEFDGAIDGREGALAVLESGEAVAGDGLAAEGSEDAVVLGRIGLEGDGAFGEGDAGIGGGGGARLVVKLLGDLGDVGLGEGGGVLGGGGVGIGAGGVEALGGEAVERGAILFIPGVEEIRGGGGDGDRPHRQKTQCKHAPLILTGAGRFQR